VLSGKFVSMVRELGVADARGHAVLVYDLKPYIDWASLTPGGHQADLEENKNK